MLILIFIWMTVTGLAAAIAANPSEFWIDAPPNYWLTAGHIILCVLPLVFFLISGSIAKRDEASIALTAYINEIPVEQRKQLAEPNPHYNSNSGHMRWKAGAKQTKLGYLIPDTPPSYSKL